MREVMNPKKGNRVYVIGFGYGEVVEVTKETNEDNALAEVDVDGNIKLCYRGELLHRDIAGVDEVKLMRELYAYEREVQIGRATKKDAMIRWRIYMQCIRPGRDIDAF